MLPRFLRNPFSNKLMLSTALMGLCLGFHSYAQTSTSAPASARFPGIMESFEKLITLDITKLAKKKDLLTKSGATTLVTDDFSSVELDVDFLNSVILHSDPSYITLSQRSKCAFYDTLINDLLKTGEGKISNILLSYLDKKKQRVSAVVSKKDFISKVVSTQCPETAKLIEQFQVKNLDETLASTKFEIPTGLQQCVAIHWEWTTNPKTPYFCNIADFIRDAKLGAGDQKDLAPRKALAKILEKKIPPTQQDYLDLLCSNIHQPYEFCNNFLEASFWNRLMASPEQRFVAQDICRTVTGVGEPSSALLKQCYSRLRKEPELCLYTSGRNQGLSPAPQCDSLSTAFNHSTLRSNYHDCPTSSDQQGVTNLSRILYNISGEKIPTFNGPCSVVSSGAVLEFNKRFNNDENWKLEACFEDRMFEKERCYKTFFGGYGVSEESYNEVVANILRQTRGADQTMKCQMVDSEDYNPLLLQYKSGCYIIFERSKCFISECKHKILYNDRPIDFIKVKNRVTLDYFPLTVQSERFSQHYLLTKDFKQTGKTVNNLSALKTFFKKNRKGIVHGIGCAEDLLPTFFQIRGMNSCSPLPFIIDGIITEGEKTTLVTRTSADSLQTPRLISWSNLYSAVRTYQRQQPLRIWTMYALD